MIEFTDGLFWIFKDLKILKEENFDLKLRIYLLETSSENKPYCKYSSDIEDHLYLNEVKDESLSEQSFMVPNILI